MRIAIIMLLIFSASFPVCAAASATPPLPSVSMDGEDIIFSQPPIIEKGTLLVPVRNVLEALGAEVTWDQESKEVIGVTGERTVKIQVESGMLEIDQHIAINIQHQIKVVNGTTYAPLRMIADAFDRQVSWDQRRQTATIHTARTYELEELEIIQERLFEYFDEIQKEHNIVIMYGGVFDGFVQVNFRKFGVHDKFLNHEEFEAIRNSFYRAAGASFPLQLEQFVMKEEPDMAGMIEEIHGKSQLLIVHSNIEQSYPEAAQITLTEDAVLEGGEALQVGQWVKVWFAGLMLTSNPVQTQAVKIEIIEEP